VYIVIYYQTFPYLTKALVSNKMLDVLYFMVRFIQSAFIFAEYVTERVLNAQVFKVGFKRLNLDRQRVHSGI